MKILDTNSAFNNNARHSHDGRFWIYCDLPFDLAQSGESFDSAQDREPVERLVETFGI